MEKDREELSPWARTAVTNAHRWKQQTPLSQGSEGWNPRAGGQHGQVPGEGSLLGYVPT